MIDLKLIRRKTLGLLAAGLAFSLAANVFAQHGGPLNEADMPVDLLGNYHTPGNRGAAGNAKASTAPALGPGNLQVVEMSGTVLAEDGTFTPFDDIVREPADLAVGLNGRAFQFEVDMEDAPGRPVLMTPNAVFVAGAGSTIGTSAVTTPAQVEITRVGSIYNFWWRNSAGLSFLGAAGHPSRTQFRIRVVFDAAGTSATVIVTPLDGTIGNADLVFPVALSGGAIGTQGFVAGMYTTGPAGGPVINGTPSPDVDGHVEIRQFVTNGNNNLLYLMAETPWRTNNPASGAPPADQPGIAGLPATYLWGFSMPSQRTFAWQAHVELLEGASLIDLDGAPGVEPIVPPGFRTLPYAGPAGADFTPGLPVFDVTMPPPLDGSLRTDDDAPATGGNINTNQVSGGAWSIAIVSPGTDDSHALLRTTHAITSFTASTAITTGAARPTFRPRDFFAPNQFTTVQDQTGNPIATTLTESGTTNVDNVPPDVSTLSITQTGNPGFPPVLNQGDVTIRFRGEDNGVTGSTTPTRGTGLARKPQAVLRNGDVNGSLLPGYQAGDFILTDMISASDDNMWEINGTIGTPGSINVTCGANYRVIIWIEDRVALTDTLVSPVFEIRLLNNILVSLRIAGFSGANPDAIHATGAPATSPATLLPGVNAQDYYQRWITFWIGGAPGGPPGANPQGPYRYDRLVLFTSAGVADWDPTTAAIEPYVLDTSVGPNPTPTPPALRPCPGPALWMTVKDRQHTLAETNMAVAVGGGSSNYTVSFTGPQPAGNAGTPGDHALRLGDLNDDDVIGIADFGLFLSKYGFVYTQNDITVIGPPRPAPVLLHADLNGDRIVNVVDYIQIFLNNNDYSDIYVSAYTSLRPGPQRIRVTELLAMGIREAKRWDFDNDGWVTWKEMEKVLALKQTGRWK